MRKTKHKRLGDMPKFILAILTLISLGVASITVIIKVSEQGIEIRAKTATIEYSEGQVPAIIEGDWGELTEDATIPTVEEIDGGRFEDIDTGLSVKDGEYTDLGWAEFYDVSSPEAFKDATLNKCIYANNKFGAQCVSLARVFWWSYADRDVTTCGTGMAKGMMNCADENAGDDFVVYWKDSTNKIQAGDWLVFDSGIYGHVCMALGPVSNGYVACLGENQGGRYCDKGGAATNIVNISTKKLVGFYRPVDYIIPEPTPIVPDTGTADF